MDLGAKLQVKAGQTLEGIHVPDSVESDLPMLTTKGSKGAADGLIVFVVDRAALEAQRKTIAAAVAADQLTWVCYPKAGQLGTDLNRDSLAALLIESSAQPVRQVAIDDVWSALRFRPT